MTKFKAFLILSRPHFLLGGILMFGLGATTSENVEWVHYLFAQAMVSSAQITAHYVNEYFDVEADRLVTNRTLFSGGSGALSSRAIAPRVALLAAVLSSVAAIGTSAVVANWSWEAAGLGVIALAISWAYSAPPLRLLDTGLGEAATSAVVAILVPSIGAFATGGSFSPYLAWATAGLFLVHFAMMLAFELPDLSTDAAAGKTVLAVRVGEIHTRRLLAGLLAAPLLTLAVTDLVGDVERGFWLAAGASLVPAVTMMLSAGLRRYAVLTTSAVATLVCAAGTLLLAAP